MFNENYKNAMDSINADSETKEKILNKIILKEELKMRKNPAIPWRIAFACVACIAIILGIIFVPQNSFIPATNNAAPETLVVSKSYNEIYKLIKPKNNYSFWNGFGVTEDEAIIYEEEIEYVDQENVIFNDGADTMDGATSAPNATNNSATKPGASKGEGSDANNSDKDDFSTTTEQVEGVAEADIVKTDGEYIYYIKGTTFSIYTADGENSKLVSRTELSREHTTDYGDMFLKDDRVIILQPDHFGKSVVSLLIYDISDPVTPKKVVGVCQDGWYNSSRMIGDYIYVISNCHINIQNIDKDDPATFVPTTEINGVCEPVPADSIYRYEQENYNSQYTVIGAFNYKDGTMSDTASLLGGTDNIYCSQGNIILADTTYSQRNAKSEDDADETVISYDVTTVSRLTIKKGKIEYKTSGEVEGTLKNQFFIDEHNGYFRFVTTVTKGIEKRYEFDNQEQDIVSYSNETFAQLTVLDSELKKVGEIGDLAKGERVYSVRFMGDIAYFVTFRQTDPLFSADLSDPANPKILGELKIPGFSEYMYPYGDGLLLGFGMDADENTGRTKDLKLSMFNITDPANVTEQDITKVDGKTYSPALNNHKAMLVDPGKNLIGFAATGNYQNMKYMIHEYVDGGFNKLAELEIDGMYKYAMDDVRGLFVGNNFYIVSLEKLQVFDINTFLQIAVVEK